MKFSAKDIVVLDDRALRSYQLELLKIAKDVVAVFEEYNLDYSLSGGSILGAIRHHGFIPWDDDIDFNITRESYDKFIDLFEETLGDRYYVQTPQNHAQLGIMVTQIRKKGTIARRKYDWNQDECGISIDFYIMENVFDNPVKRFIQKNMSMVCAFAISSIRYIHNRDLPEKIKVLEGREEHYSTPKIMLGKVLGVIPLKIWIRWCNYWNSACHDTKSKQIAIPTGRKHFAGEIYDRSKMCSFKKVAFETEKFNVPVWTDGYLTMFYGNYMKIPPIDKHERHLFLELKY